MTKGFEADLALIVMSAEIFALSPVAFLSFYISYAFKEKDMKVDCTGYIYLHIYFYNGSFGSEHTNKYKNNRDCT